MSKIEDTVPVMILVNKEIYTEYKKLGKVKGFVPKLKLAEQVNSFMSKQNVKG